MLEKKDLAVNDNSEMNRKLLKIKEAAYNPKMAAEARRISEEADKNRKPFNRKDYEEHLKRFPEFQYLHLVYDEFDE